MRLDIGSAEGPDVNADVHLDVDTDEEYWTGREKLCNNVDILADAHRLPFRDEVFESARAGYIFFNWTGTDAIDEAFRVLQSNGEIDIVTHKKHLPMIVEYIKDKGVIVCIDHESESFGPLIKIRKKDSVAEENSTCKGQVDFPRRTVEHIFHYREEVKAEEEYERTMQNQVEEV